MEVREYSNSIGLIGAYFSVDFLVQTLGKIESWHLFVNF